MEYSKIDFRYLILHGLFAIFAAGFVCFYVSFAIGHQTWDAFRAAGYILTFQAFVYARIVPNKHPSEFMGRYKTELMIGFLVFLFGFVFIMLFAPDTAITRGLVGGVFLIANIFVIFLHIREIRRSLVHE